MNTQKRKVELFTAGCLVCEPAVYLVQRVACPGCDVSIYNARSASGLDVGLGAQITVNSKPSRLDPIYGSGTPVGFEIFFRIRPSRMDHLHQHMTDQMPAAE